MLYHNAMELTFTGQPKPSFNSFLLAQRFTHVDGREGEEVGRWVAAAPPLSPQIPHATLSKQDQEMTNGSL